MEVYKAVKSGDRRAIEGELNRLRQLMRGPFMEEFGFGDKHSHMFIMELPMMLDHMLRRTLESEQPPLTTPAGHKVARLRPEKE